MWYPSKKPNRKEKCSRAGLVVFNVVVWFVINFGNFLSYFFKDGIMKTWHNIDCYKVNLLLCTGLEILKKVSIYNLYCFPKKIMKISSYSLVSLWVYKFNMYGIENTTILKNFKIFYLLFKPDEICGLFCNEGTFHSCFDWILCCGRWVDVVMTSLRNERCHLQVSHNCIRRKNYKLHYITMF